MVRRRTERYLTMESGYLLNKEEKRRAAPSISLTLTESLIPKQDSYVIEDVCRDPYRKTYGKVRNKPSEEENRRRVRKKRKKRKRT